MYLLKNIKTSTSAKTERPLVKYRQLPVSLFYKEPIKWTQQTSINDDHINDTHKGGVNKKKCKDVCKCPLKFIFLLKTQAAS